MLLSLLENSETEQKKEIRRFPFFFALTLFVIPSDQHAVLGSLHYIALKRGLCGRGKNINFKFFPCCTSPMPSIYTEDENDATQRKKKSVRMDMAMVS